MWQLLWDTDWVAEASFILWRWLFPLWHQSPVELSPIDVAVDWRVLKERVELGCVIISHLEELSECFDVGMLFLEKLDDCFSFPLVGGGGVWQ